MNTELHDLYDKVLLDHNRRPRNHRVIEGGLMGERYNPLCGDRITVFVRVEADVIREVSFQSAGCAISRASASLMTEAVNGRMLGDVGVLADRFRQMITTPPGEPIDDLGPLSALSGVRLFPTRIKCAVLAWEALGSALVNSRPSSC